MNEANADSQVSRCRNCGKNLQHLKPAMLIEINGHRFCSFDCAEVMGLKVKRPKKRSYR